MFKLINVEFYKLMRRWLPYILLLTLILLMVFSKVVSYSGYNNFTAQHPDIHVPPGASSITITSTVPGSVSETRPNGITSIQTLNVGSWKSQLVLPGAMDGVLGGILSLGAFLVIILAAQVVGTEYAWGTLRQTLIKGVSRRKFLVTKFLTLAIAILAGVAIALLVGFLIGMLTTQLVESGIDWSFMTWGYVGNLLANVARVLLVLGVYLSLTVILCVLLRSAGTALAVGLGIYFVDSIVSALAMSSSGLLKEIFRFSIGYNVQQFTASFSATNLQEAIRPLWQSSGILSAWMVLFVLAAFYFLRRQDLTA
jgi:ABC-2 type transport system permease protein